MLDKIKLSNECVVVYRSNLNLVPWYKMGCMLVYIIDEIFCLLLIYSSGVGFLVYEVELNLEK